MNRDIATLPKSRSAETTHIVTGNEHQPPSSTLTGSYFRASRRFQDPRIHAWYNSVMGFSDSLVNLVLDRFSASSETPFLDPYCGSGTSLIEAQKRGLEVYGIDANPASVLASRTKTDWMIDLRLARETLANFHIHSGSLKEDSDDPIISYLEKSGMIRRGWITAASAIKAASIKRWIDKCIPKGAVQDLFMLALVSTVVNDLANIKFGPELYCVKPERSPPNPAQRVGLRIDQMLSDLESLPLPYRRARVHYGDARDGRTLRHAADWTSRPVNIVTSPPYPTEHDYTRNSRLELVFLEAVSSTESLRRIKRRMIRSHSKGIYVGDRDSEAIRGFAPVDSIANEISSRTQNSTSGFEGQYPRVITNYFGGLLRHFRSLSRYLPRGSKLAYVVGDQASYKSVHIATGDIICQLIERYLSRLVVDDVVVWRSRPTHGRSSLGEHILFLSVCR